jgi:hypothetical protein
MNESIEPRPSDAAAEAAGSGALDRIRLRRRKFLIGGAATGGVMFTLGNRPVAAATTNCSISAIGSVNPSATVRNPCGDSPGCWKNKDFAVWADGAKFNNIPVTFTHSTLITSVFTVLASAPFTVGTNPADTLANMIINGNAIFKVKMQNNTHVQFWTAPGQQLNLVAAILNNYFYGAHYSATDIRTVINGVLSNIKADAAANNSSDITTQTNNLDNMLNTLNNQGETCAL